MLKINNRYLTIVLPFKGVIFQNGFVETVPGIVNLLDPSSIL